MLLYENLLHLLKHSSKIRMCFAGFLDMALMKLSRLNCGNQSFYLYLSSEPDNGRIDLTLSNAVKSWRGNGKYVKCGNLVACTSE